MPDNSMLQSLIKTVGLEEEAELLRSIGELKEEMVGLVGKVEGAGSALDLLRKIAATPDDEDVVAAFEAIGAEGLLTDLAGAADRLELLVDKVPAEVVTLLEPLGRFDEGAGAERLPGLVNWPLFDKSGDRSGGSDLGYEFEFGGKAALAIEAGDQWPYSDDMPGALLRMRAEGSFKGEAGAKLPFNVGSIGIDGGASGAAHVEYYFAPAELEELFALAAGDRLAELTNPFRLGPVWNAFQNSDLAAIHFQFDGDAHLNLQVALAKAFSVGEAVDVSVGAAVDAGFELSGLWQLSLRRDPAAIDEQRIIATLSRHRSRKADLLAKLGAQVDVTQLVEPVQRFLKDALDKWDGALEELKPYLSPGTLLQSEASEFIKDRAGALVSDPDLKSALVRDLQGLVGVGTPTDSQITKWLEGRLVGSLDAAHGWAKNKTTAAVNLVDALGTSLPALGQDKFSKLLETEATKLVEKAQEKLRAFVKGKVSDSSSAFSRALSKAGQKVKGSATDFDDVMASVRGLIDRYDQILRKIVDAAQDASRGKLSAALQIEEERLDQSIIEIQAVFDGNTPEAQSAFKALVEGNLNTLVDLLSNASDPVGFELDCEKSSLTRFVSSKSGLGYELVLFGFGISGERLLESSAEVLVDGNGNVAVDTKSKLEKRFKALDAEREISLISSYSLKLARTHANGPEGLDRALGLSLSFGHIDDGLKRHEVTRFVTSLADAGLLANESVKLADETFTRWIGNPGSNGKVKGRLQLKLALDRVSMARLLHLSESATSGTLPDSIARQVVLGSFAKIRVSDEAMARDIAITSSMLREEFPDESMGDLVLDTKRAARPLKVKMTGSNLRRLPEVHDAYFNAARLSAGMRKMVETLREIYFSTPETQKDSDPATWNAKDYSKAEKRAVKAVEGWLKLNSALFWTNSKVHPLTIAFMERVAEMSGVDIAERLSLVMTKADGARSETVVLHGGDTAA